MAGVSHWTPEMIAFLREYYPTMSSRKIAKRLGVSHRTVLMKGRELGIENGSKTQRLRAEVIIRANFEMHSLNELAKMTGVSVSAVRRIARKLGLAKDVHRIGEIRRRARLAIIEKERRRIIFGLPQKTKLKVVSNRSKHNLRYRFRKDGYYVERGENLVYFDERVHRHLLREESAKKHGLMLIAVDDGLIDLEGEADIWESLNEEGDGVQ